MNSFNLCELSHITQFLKSKDSYLCPSFNMLFSAMQVSTEHILNKPQLTWSCKWEARLGRFFRIKIFYDLWRECWDWKAQRGDNHM